MTAEKKIGVIKEELQAAEDISLPFFIEEYETDARSGVQKLVEQAKKHLQKLEAEKKRIYALQEYEIESNIWCFASLYVLLRSDRCMGRYRCRHETRRLGR